MKKQLYYLFAVIISLLSTSVFSESLIEDASTQKIEPFVDLLIWHAAETNASWGTTIAFPGNAIDIVQSTPNFSTKPGIRGGLLYSPNDHTVDTKLYYTYYSTKSNNAISPGLKIVSSLFFSGSYFISGDLFFGGASNWSLMMNMLDFELSHAFHPSNALTLTPKIGLKGATIDQAIQLNWNAILYQATEKLNNNFTGVGPSYGVNANWNFYKELSLVGDISSALMYGSWRDNDTYTRPASSVTTPTIIKSSSGIQKLGTMMMDYYLGLEWHHHGKSDVAIRLGYEMQYWPNQLRLVAVQQLPTFGDLTFQGIACNFTIAL